MCPLTSYVCLVVHFYIIHSAFKVTLTKWKQYKYQIPINIKITLNHTSAVCRLIGWWPPQELIVHLLSMRPSASVLSVILRLRKSFAQGETLKDGQPCCWRHFFGHCWTSKSNNSAVYDRMSTNLREMRHMTTHSLMFLGEAMYQRSHQDPIRSNHPLVWVLKVAKGNGISNFPPTSF